MTPAQVRAEGRARALAARYLDERSRRNAGWEFNRSRGFAFGDEVAPAYLVLTQARDGVARLAVSYIERDDLEGAREATRAWRLLEEARERRLLAPRCGHALPACDTRPVS